MIGLADITCKRDGHVIINSSPLKGQPTKMFRHRLASHLIDAMNKHDILSQNQVKTIVGHTKFATTAEIYGNKLLKMTNETRNELADAKEAATHSDLLSQVISQNN
jgi:integrase